MGEIHYLVIDRTNKYGRGRNRINELIRQAIPDGVDTSQWIRITDISVYPDNFEDNYFDYLYVDGEFVHDPQPRPDIPEEKVNPPAWYHSAGPPPDNMADIGDYCLDTATGAIFHKTTGDDFMGIWQAIYTPPKIIRFIDVFGPSNSGVHQDSRFIRFPEKLVGGTKIIQVTPAIEPGQNYNDGFSATIGEITDEGFWVEVCRTDQTEPWGQNLHLHVTVTHQP